MGGGDIPASGFALYLDPLMNLVASETPSEPLKPVILVRAEKEDVLKAAFDAASRLREAGYVAEFELGGQAPAGLRWILDVRSKKPFFVLRDEVKSSQAEMSTIEEVLQAIPKG